MRMATLAIVLPFLTFSGCQLSSPGPDPHWLVDFHNADSILIRNHHSQREISDAETVNRLRTIYENAEWKPYWHTLPGNLGDRTIELLDGETKLRQFSYTGTLWETESSTENRTAKLSDADAQWIESLFALVADGESSALHDKSK